MLGGFFGGGSNNNDDSSSSTSSSSTPLSSPSPFSGLGQSGGDTKSRLQNAINTQVNLMNGKFLIQKINENCFEHCVTDPGTSLSGKEQTCLSNCMEKYIDGWNTVSKAYYKRAQTELGPMAGQAGLGGLPGGSL